MSENDMKPMLRLPTEADQKRVHDTLRAALARLRAACVEAGLDPPLLVFDDRSYQVIYWAGKVVAGGHGMQRLKAGGQDIWGYRMDGSFIMPIGFLPGPFEAALSLHRATHAAEGPKAGEDAG